MSDTTYNRIIRKIVVGFGNLFDNITLVRYNLDETEQERFVVPIAYAAKELYVQRLEGDPDLDKKVQMTLPRISYNMNGISYDSSRKLNTNMKNFAQTSTGAVSQYNPVPYDFDFSLYIYVRNTEDGLQIIEHIMPFFTPDYTIKLNLIPEMGIVKEIPIVLKSTDYEVQYEGARDIDPRLIIWTLNFTVKGFIFGKISETGLIKNSITNIFNNISTTDTIILYMNSGTGKYKRGEYVYQGYSPEISTATGIVSDFTSNNELYLTNINGNFVSNKPIVGLTTNVSYNFSSYVMNPKQQLAQIVVVPNPVDAQANGNYTYTTDIQDVPNINTNVTDNSQLYGDLFVQIGNQDLTVTNGTFDLT